eukprot:CAMPEP_0205833814 /NCGR_PEP_ID=MMETSP0206-20130828/50298_1 /ASSEMBLY_ACC=CAM_ASM_000279 /TAXON_ID=36767 /ORGANISM="Euplotes focardii, Strain TN1" /LENGTH=208 /DNA_ID=CAMNT_0053140523 /DNA_START=553 /DNA_END=1179 /DNA_ORIENTATION=+
MIENCEKALGNIKNLEDVDLMKLISTISIGVLAEILFGYDWKQNSKSTYPFENGNGEVEELELMDFMAKLVLSYTDEYLNPIASLVPTLAKYNLINPFKRNNRNYKCLKKTIIDIADKSKDTNSVANKLRECEGLTDDEKVDDLILLIMAGHDTTAHSIVSCLYFVSKSPEFYEQLREELESNELRSKATFKDNLNLDSLQDLNYLSC